MASVPSFDLTAAREIAAADPTDPLTNRALRGRAPGAPFLLITGLAGLRKGLTPETTFNCQPIMYGNKQMKCWIHGTDEQSHGDISLNEALKLSCGTFFYQWGNAAGIEQIGIVGKLLGLGEKSGLPLASDNAGILPGPQWLKTANPNERWSNGYTANVSIGQGALSTTPLQMAMVAATFANGGLAYVPRLLASVPVRLRADLRNEGVSTEAIEIIRRSMWKKVNESGVGGRARLANIEVAGSTGTTQSWRGEQRDKLASFMGFAPYENPRLAICVLVEGGTSGGTVAAPIARHILEQALSSQFTPALQPLAPAKGSFQAVESLE
jgi:penicillin-binding protein 2